MVRKTLGNGKLDTGTTAMKFFNVREWAQLQILPVYMGIES